MATGEGKNNENVEKHILYKKEYTVNAFLPLLIINCDKEENEERVGERHERPQYMST